jgi:DnaJ-domain-containing protein 1
MSTNYKLPTLYKLLNMNYYQLFGVKPSSSIAEIQQAYQKLKTIYQPNHIAAYSLFSNEDLEKISRRLDDAFALLANPNRRKEYDSTLADGKAELEIEEKDAKLKKKLMRSSPDNVKQKKSEIKQQPGLIYDGRYLKELRQLKKMSLDEISKITKIRIPILNAIETLDINLLPDRIYLKSFLKEYAKCLKLNPMEVSGSYLHVYDKMKAGKDK